MTSGLLLRTESRIHQVKNSLDEIKEFNTLPANQLKDIENTLDRMLSKAKLHHQKQLRREQIEGA